MDSHGIHGAIHVTFGDGFEQPTDEACSSFQRCLPNSITLDEVREILAAWAGHLDLGRGWSGLVRS